MNDTEKEVSNLKFVLAEKENVVKQWSARGADIERINSDINLLRSQLGQLQTDNQILRNNIQLDPEYNYIIIWNNQAGGRQASKQNLSIKQ